MYGSRGTEWSVASVGFTANADGNITLRLRRVAPADGYLSTEWHVHQIGSPDSPVPSDQRVRSALSAGIEMFPVTDHDFVADLQPIVEDLGLTDQVRILTGVEVTPFVYGHFNAWPMTVDTTSPNGGAVDWARGREGYAMTPGEIYADLRARGAELIQVNHPRKDSSFAELQAYFDRANITYDYDARTIFGDFMGADISYTNADLRLPGESLWSDAFNALEIWNAFATDDTDGDGTRELVRLDKVMRDWFNMLSLGFVVTPTGSSDTHSSVVEPVGMPRTYVRVPDDSPVGLSSGAAVADVIATLTGAAPRDVIVTDGPMLEVRSGDDLRDRRDRRRDRRQRDLERGRGVSGLGGVRHARGVRERDAGDRHPDHRDRAGPPPVLDQPEPGDDGSGGSVPGGHAPAGAGADPAREPARARQFPALPAVDHGDDRPGRHRHSRRRDRAGRMAGVPGPRRSRHFPDDAGRIDRRDDAAGIARR